MEGLGMGVAGSVAAVRRGIGASYIGRVGTAYRPRGDGRWLGWHAVPTLPEARARPTRGSTPDTLPLAQR